MAISILGHNYIGGRRSGQGAVTQRSVSAATGEAHPLPFLEATGAEIDAAVAAAEAAFGQYRQMPAARRADFLDTIAEELEALGEDFLPDTMRETGLPAARLLGERARTSNQLRLFGKVLRRGDFYGARIDIALPERQPMPCPDVRQYKIGIGPVAVFGASNFPLAFSVAGGDTASALAAGCPVVVKAHAGHLVTSEIVADAIERAVKRCAMPAGVFNMIYGDRVGKQLVQAPGIKAVGFTGSLQGGRALCDLAAARPEPIPVFAEMSSVNPIFILPQVIEQRGASIATELAASVNMGCGQLCTNPGIVIGVRSPQFTLFLERLRTAFAAHAPQIMLNGAVLANYQAATRRMSELDGVRVLVTAEAGPHQAAPYLFQGEPSLLADPSAPLEDEMFGPATVVVEVGSHAELLAFARGMRGHLTATVLGERAELLEQQELMSCLEERVGRLLVNGFPTGLEVCDAMVHGGPYPATSDARGTSVGSAAIDRFLRPVCFQNYPDELLPQALRKANPLGLLRLVNGEQTRAAG
ncbi:aldehyde dehydrogenase (NADP(+)) [Herbaspirillum sp. RV1423]|uniref:aldehyde dehydrogenase (NADP(+)) n=1 Tax=Herbaspirillum sp. RV1423 TaxID=1443993 RepID=UPI0004B1EC90|nr:aldehyde dehydrogenase (NADP(+)) [Herbaspirillum sp. RV1423]